MTFPKHVCVIGAAGGLGQGILQVCRDEGIRFTAVVRSRPERIVDVPDGSRVVVIEDLADVDGLAAAFHGVDAVLTATGVTATSRDRSALLSENLESIESAMRRANVDRIVVVNTLIASAPGDRPSLWTRVFTWFPGTVGRGAKELQAMPVALGRGAWSGL
ncbi:MAG: NAD(P)H-binding protein, partial [Planctomycetota bacterium]